MSEAVLGNDHHAAIMQARRLFAVARKPKADPMFSHLRPLLKDARIKLVAARQAGDESIETGELFREVCTYLGTHSE